MAGKRGIDQCTNSHYVLLGCVIRKADQASQDDDFSYFHFFPSLCLQYQCVCATVCARESSKIPKWLCKEESAASLTLRSLVSLPDEILGKRRVCSPTSSTECPLESKKARSESPKGKCCFSLPHPLFSSPFPWVELNWNEGGRAGSCVWHWGCSRRRPGLCFFLYLLAGIAS